MISFISALSFVFALAAGAVEASEFHKPNVVDLKGKDFEEKVSDGTWFVKFYAPWCGHCKRLADTWGELGTAFKDDPKVNVAHVDCTVEKPICDKFEVRGYPTLKAIANGKEFKQYSGGRDLDSLKKWLGEVAKENNSETTA